MVWTSLVAQWWRIHLPMQETWVGFPGPGRFHMPWGKWTCAKRLLSLCPRARGLQLLKSTCSRAHAPQQEKPLQGEVCAPQWRVAPLTTTRENPRAAKKTQQSHKLIKNQNKHQWFSSDFIFNASAIMFNCWSHCQSILKGGQILTNISSKIELEPTNIYLKFFSRVPGSNLAAWRCIIKSKW